MRRIVIDAADVLTVLKRERKGRDGTPTAAPQDLETDVADEATHDALPPELAELEDTALRQETTADLPPHQDNGTQSNGISEH
jgi:hypothetical protein